MHSRQVRDFVPSHLPALYDGVRGNAVHAAATVEATVEAFEVCCEWCLDCGLWFAVCCVVVLWFKVYAVWFIVCGLRFMFFDFVVCGS